MTDQQIEPITGVVPTVETTPDAISGQPVPEGQLVHAVDPTVRVRFEAGCLGHRAGDVAEIPVTELVRALLDKGYLAEVPE